MYIENANEVKNDKDLSLLSTDLKPCPFCGGKGHIGLAEKATGKNTSGILPEGAVIDAIKPRLKGGNLYFWKKYGYSCWCENTDCVCSQTGKVYDSFEEAQNHWNLRV